MEANLSHTTRGFTRKFDFNILNYITSFKANRQGEKSRQMGSATVNGMAEADVLGNLLFFAVTIKSGNIPAVDSYVQFKMYYFQ